MNRWKHSTKSDNKIQIIIQCHMVAEEGKPKLRGDKKNAFDIINVDSNKTMIKCLKTVD